MKKDKHRRQDDPTDYTKLVHGRNFVPLKRSRPLCRTFYGCSFVMGIIMGLILYTLGKLGVFAWLFAG